MVVYINDAIIFNKYLQIAHQYSLIMQSLNFVTAICDRICENVHSSHKNLNSFF